MSRSVIVVRTANRPDVLRRCLAAALDGCDVAREAHWLVLDDSSPDSSAATREVAQFWKRFGLKVAYANETAEEQIAESLPRSTLRDSFRRLVPRSPSCRAERGRNLGLLAGLSQNPDVLFFIDDDIVHRHERNCFFHFCAGSRRTDSFIAAPRKLGICDMTYLSRLADVLDRDDWAAFVSDAGISSDGRSWYSPKNPFWKRGDIENDRSRVMVAKREVLNGQFIALRNRGAEWLPFPSEYNEDLNWSLLQSACLGTPLLKITGANVQHLPPHFRHPGAETIFSELVGTAITRGIRQIKPRGEETMTTLAVCLPDALAIELKQELFAFLNVERAVLSRMRGSNDGMDAVRTISRIAGTLADVAERLKSIDSRHFAGEWLDDFAVRRKMFLELRRHDGVQKELRRVLSGDSL